MDERQTDQLVPDAEVNCQLDGVDHQLSLYDLSASGCMVESPKVRLPLGRKLVVNVFRNLAVPARVVWQRGGRIGLRFLAPLQSDLVQQLALTIRQRASDRYAFHDNFGRATGGLPDFPEVVSSLQSPRAGRSFAGKIQP